MEDTHYKLIYFPLRARAEPIRMIFALAGVDYEETTITQEQWPGKKEETPLGQLPLLEVNGRTIAQSTVIAKYLAKKLGFLGQTLWEETVSDMIAVSANELNTKIGGGIYMHTIFKAIPKPADLEERVTSSREAWVKLLKMAKELQAKSGSTKFINGNEITLADIYLYCVLEYSSVALPDIMSINEWTENFVKRFESDERVAKYLQTRKMGLYGI